MEVKENTLLKIIFLISIVIFCIGMTCVKNIPDNDLWARLIAGGYIVENLDILKYDFLSYTPTHAWYDHEWGASIFFYLALKYFGDSGLIILKGILTALTILICYKTVELRKPQSTVPYNILYFAIMFLVANKALGPTIRCLLFTCLFFALFIYILEKVRITNNYKYLIFLPIIMLFWSNIHGGCISGIGLLAIYCVGEFLNKKPIKNYFITLIACLLSLFINPYGFEYVKFLFYAATMDRNYISEWTSPFHSKYLYSYMRYKIYLIIMLLTQVIYFIKTKITYSKLDKTKFLIIITMTYLSIMHIRHQSFFIFTVGTLLYDEFYTIFDTIIKYIKDKLKINEEVSKSILLLKEICVYFFIIILAFPPLLNKNKEIIITDTKYPRFAIEFIQINNLKGNLFINFDWGSYAAYKLYPNNLIYMDGRYEEVYYNETKELLDNFYNLQNNWDEILDKEYNHDYIIVPKDALLNDYLSKRKDYKIIYSDNDNFLYIKSNLKYKINNKMDESIIYDLLEPFKTSVKYTNNNK